MTATKPTPTAFYYNAKDRPQQPELRQALTTTSQALRAAVWAVPGVPEAEAALHRFDDFRTHVLEHTRGAEADSIAGQLVAAITSGDIVTPDEFLSTLEDLHHRDQLIAMTGNVVDVMGAKLWANRTQIIASAERAVVRHLQHQLDALLSDLRKLDFRSSDLDASAAIAGDRVTQHRALLEAVDAFQDLTGGVRAWHAAHNVGNGVPHYWVAALIPNPLDVDPLVGVALADCFAFNPTTGERYEGDTKWPDLEDTGLTLVWLSQHPELTDHIPTVSTWRAREAALRAAKSDALGAANGAMRLRVVREGRLTKRLIEGTPDTHRRTVTVSNHDAETDDQWQVRYRTSDVSE